MCVCIDIRGLKQARVPHQNLTIFLRGILGGGLLLVKHSRRGLEEWYLCLSWLGLALLGPGPKAIKGIRAP